MSDVAASVEQRVALDSTQFRRPIIKLRLRVNSRAMDHVPEAAYRGEGRVVGAFVREYAPPSSSLARNALLLCLGLAVAAGALAYVVLGNPSAYATIGAAWGAVMGIVLGGAAAGSIVRRNTRVGWFEDRIECVGPGGARTLPLDEIESVYVKITDVDRGVRFLARRYRIEIVPRSGRKLRLDESIEGIDRALAWIEAQRVRVRLPQVSLQLEAGAPVQFGAITVVRDGIRSKSATLRWSELRSVWIDRGELSIRDWERDAVWLSTHSWLVPDTAVLLAVIASRAPHAVNAAKAK